MPLAWQVRQRSEVLPGVMPDWMAWLAFAPTAGAPVPLSYIAYEVSACSVWFHSGR